MFGQTDLLTACDDPVPVEIRTQGRKSSRNERRGKSRLVRRDTSEAAAGWVTLITRIRDSRDEQAFVALFEHFAPRVKGYLIRSGADEALAEEVMQDVMTTIWRKAAQFDPSRASAATWIFTIARNRRIDVLRKQRRPEPEDLTWGPEAEPDQADVLGLQQETEHLGAAIAALPDKQRDLIEKAYFGELSHSEIAEATGLPLGTIKSRIRLALDRLRHAMSQM
ncbi:sigma-70 family RNA polymerase sigma factor [Primorskyibacter sp. 2E107]|uniref:sigma-70 family RNA polymerase sigma factor n=1 Tax=Primorskyibacter sp. 2E107 TaxID=3403458 RepID=UPI003AF696F9